MTELRSSQNCEVFGTDKSMDCLSVSKFIAGFLNAGKYREDHVKLIKLLN